MSARCQEHIYLPDNLRLIACVDNLKDGVETSIEMKELEVKSINIFKVSELKFIMTFSAEVEIRFYFDGREEFVRLMTDENEELRSEDSVGDYLFEFDVKESSLDIKELIDLIGSDAMISFYVLK
mgnify:CR=1 FL=1